MKQINLYIRELLKEDIVKMDKIIHMDEMSTEDFINFVKNFVDIENRNIEISEKMDGMNFSFGLDKKDSFFSKTKSSKPVKNPSIYGDFSFLQGIKDYHRVLKRNKKILDSVKEQIKNYGEYDSPFDLQVFGELLPNSQTNIVRYDKDKIGNGAIVLFDIKVDGKSILQERYARKVFESLVSQLNDQGGWKVYDKPLVDSKKFQFDINHFITLEELYEKYFDVLKSRKKADRDTKKKAKRVIQSLMDNIKQQFLKAMVQNRKSILGKVAPEGLILRDFSNNLLVKLVDKDSFTAANQAGSQYIKPAQLKMRSVKKDIKDDIFGNADIMKNFAKVIEKSVDWAFTKKQTDPNFKVQSLDQILKVAYDDMMDEGRIKYSAKQAVKKTTDYLKEAKKLIEEQLKELEKGKDDIPESKYIISKEKMERYVEDIEDVINKFKTLPTGEGIKVYLTIIAFVFGPYKIKQLKKEFDLFENYNTRKLGSIIVRG